MLNDEALNAREVASLLHIGRNGVYELAKTGALPSYRIGRKVLFALRDVEAYLASVRTAGEAHSAGATRTPDGSNTEASATTTLPSGLPGGGFSAFSLLPPPDKRGSSNGAIIPGSGIPTTLISEHLKSLGHMCSHAALTSYDALCALYEQRANAALYDQRTNSYNIPFVQRLIPGTSVIMFRLIKRAQGFAVAKGNPKGFRSWGALLRPETRLANRIRGCGSRILLDEKLLAMEARGDTIAGYGTDFSTDLIAAQMVADGVADVAVVGEHIAAQIAGIDFIPLQEEWLDLVIVKTPMTRELVKNIRMMLADPGFCSEYSRIVHGDTANLGAIVYEC